MKRRLFSILLALCMTLAMFPAAAFAGESSYDSDITIKHSGWKCSCTVRKQATENKR